MNLVCDDPKCCFSCAKKSDMANHMKQRHKRTMGDFVSVVSRANASSDLLGSSVCPKCLKTFEPKNLKQHTANCRGAMLYQCQDCPATFGEREQFISHIDTEHKPDTDFTVTGVFIGKKNSGPKSHERTLVVKKPDVRHINDALTAECVGGILDLLEHEIKMFQKVFTRLILRCIIEKEEQDGSLISKLYTSSSKQKVVFDKKSSLLFLHSSKEDLHLNMTKLELVPSGYRIREISSITLVTTPAPPILGACSDTLSWSKTKIERRGLAEIRGKDSRCLQESILYAMYAKEVFSKMRRDLRSDCKSRVHGIKCHCYATAQKLFKKVAKRGKFWMKFRNRYIIYFKFTHLPIV